MKCNLEAATRLGAVSRTATRSLVAAWVAGSLLAAAVSASGVDSPPYFTGLTRSGSNVTLNWYGPPGPYQVYTTPLLVPPSWSSIASLTTTDYTNSLTLTNLTSNRSFFRLSHSLSTLLNGYVGAGGCAGCHGDQYYPWWFTSHANSYNAMTNVASADRQSCLRCHTTGYGQATGFTDMTNTPYLSNVGCESCHGPGAAHKYGEHDLVHPIVSIAPEICGGCHNGSSVPSNPTYEEYRTTLHAQVNDDVKYGFNGGVYYTNLLVVAGTNAFGVNVVPPGTPGSTNCFGYYVTTNADLTLKSNYTTGIIHSGNGPGSGYTYDPGEDRAAGCGICHSAATRLAQLQDYEARLEGRTNALQFPLPQDSAAWTAACATCHDPHGGDNPAQLRNATRSTNYYTMPTTADKRTVITTNGIYTANPTFVTNVVFYSAAFANMYDPNVQICGQCHNSRGARWDGRSFGYYNTNTMQTVTTNGPGIVWGVQTNISYSRYPHYSPQYNVLVGIVQPDYLTTDASGAATNFIARHGIGVSSSSGIYNTNQCATCHVPQYAVNAGTNVTGHTFNLDTNGCALGGCHLGGVPNWEETQVTTSNRLTAAVALLNSWAIANGTNTFGAANAAKYGVNGWEYTLPGPLAITNLAGPSSGDQLKIPTSIRQARFNLYMAKQDGSYGVHNPGYTTLLISDATNKISSTIIGATNAAYFAASSAVGYAPFTPTFTCFGNGVTNYLWDFGGGNTSTLASPTFTYTNPGTNSVSLTVIAGGVTTTYTRNNYIKTYARPVVSFTANPTTGPTPLTVNFTNTSTSTNNVTAWRWTVGSVNITTGTNLVYTITNLTGTNVSYNVSLRATTPVASITTTSNAFITVTP